MLSAQTPHSPKLRYGGEISHDGVQCFTWDFALVCLFRPPFLEVEIKNQQDWRIIYITIKIMRPFVVESKWSSYGLYRHDSYDIPY